MLCFHPAMNKHTLLFSSVLLLCTGAAQAHLDIGTYTGRLADGSACSFDVRSVEFDGVPHPLNERVTIESNTHGTFRLSHAPQLAVPGKALVDFDHDALTGARGEKDGAAWGAILQMSHAPGNHGPKALRLMGSQDGANYDYGTCGELVFKRE